MNKVKFPSFLLTKAIKYILLFKETTAKTYRSGVGKGLCMKTQFETKNGGSYKCLEKPQKGDFVTGDFNRTATSDLL